MSGEADLAVWKDRAGMIRDGETQAGGTGAVGAGMLVNASLLLALVGPSLNMTLLPPALPMMAAYLGGGAHGEKIAQYAQTLPFLGLAVGGLFAGTLIARLGLRSCLIAAILIYCLGGAIGGLATSAPMLLAGCLALGLAGSVLSSALTTSTGAVHSGAARARMLGFQTAMSDASALGAGAAAAVLAQFFGWRALFAVYGSFGVILLLLVLPARWPEIARDTTTKGGLLVTARMAAATYLAAFLLYITLGTQMTQLPFILAQHGLASPAARALVLTSAPFVAMLAAIVYAVARGHVQDRWFVLAAALLSVSGYTAIAFWQAGSLSITLAAMATGVGVGLSFPIIMRGVFRQTPSTHHGHAMGLLTTAVFFGLFVSPIVLGPVLQLAGSRTMFLLCALMWLAGGTISVLVMRGRRHVLQ